MTKPFEGVRILDFTRVVAGPFATHQLSVLGADVVKIERPDGDDLRRSGLTREWSQRGLAPAFMAVSGNKRSIALDLKQPEAIDVIHRLVVDADVVCENFRPGVMRRFGLDHEALHKINPRLVYLSLSGFGSQGPEASKAAYDGKIQAMSGLMSITGEASSGPMRAGFAIADFTTGITAAFALASALYQRTHTGEGQFVDVSMFESMMSLLSAQVAEYTVLGHRHPQAGNLSMTRIPTADRFTCEDGYIVLAVLSDRQFASLMQAIGRADALEDPRFVDEDARFANPVQLKELIEDALSQRGAGEWEELLTAADVPCSAILSIAEAADHPQHAERAFLQDVVTPFGTVRLPGNAFELSHGTGSIDRSPPGLGEHTEEILAEAGYDSADISKLRDRGVIANHRAGC